MLLWELLCVCLIIVQFKKFTSQWSFIQQGRITIKTSKIPLQPNMKKMDVTTANFFRTVSLAGGGGVCSHPNLPDS